MAIYSVIAGTGSYIPPLVVSNKDFLGNKFYGSDGVRLEKPAADIIAKFEEITGIKERRYVTDELVTSDIAFLAAQDALSSSGIDRETLDYIIVSHNFGDVSASNKRSDSIPSLASRVKHRLKIENPSTIAMDIIFGCPGWLQGMIQANYYIKAGDAKRVLVIGAEILSRVSDMHDMDSMIYADGAGATIIEAVESEQPVGILAHAARSDTLKDAYLLRVGKSYNSSKPDELFVKMDGHGVYGYAVTTVHKVVKESLEKAGLSLKDISKVLLHQANEKMDEKILKRLYTSDGLKEVPPEAVPMTISWLGNTSVATLPTMLDLLLKGKLDSHALNSGDLVVFASVGAGMNINSMAYRMP